MRSVLALVAITILAACPGRKADTGPPPPRGTSYSDYLAEGQPERVKPADTDDSDAMTVHVIDIGQGLSVLLEFPCGAVLFDTGGEQNQVWDGVGALALYLDAFFARRTDLDQTLDLLVVSHPHLDHTRGIETVLRRYKVRNILDNGMRNEWMEVDGERVEDEAGRMQIAMEDWARARADSVGYQSIKASDVPLHGLSSGIIDPVNGCDRASTDPQIKALWGQVFEDRDTYGENLNNHSVALRVDYGEFSVFLPGDLEYEGNSRLDRKFRANKELLDVDLYIVGHHGSKNATTKYMMENMSPDIAVISASPYEREQDWTARKFGHPHTKTMKHLLSNDYGVAWKRDPIDVMIGIRGAWKDELQEIFEEATVDKAVYCTCWDGSVRIRGNANGWVDIETAGR
jgi:competence protein ComEC